MAIGKINVGSGARGLLAYLEEGRKGECLGRVEAYHVQNMIGENRNQWLQEFHAQRELSQKVEKAFGHTSISV